MAQTAQHSFSPIDERAAVAVLRKPQEGRVVLLLPNVKKRSEACHGNTVTTAAITTASVAGKMDVCSKSIAAMVSQDNALSRKIRNNVPYELMFKGLWVLSDYFSDLQVFHTRNRLAQGLDR